MKRLLLVGGGHSHLEVLRCLAMQRPPGLDTVLLAPDRYALYSGMIPGVVAGDYALPECRVDLAALSSRAGARLLATELTGLDPGRRSVLPADGMALEYDVISLDVGSVPATHGVAGVREHALPVKPTNPFLQRLAGWDQGHAPRRPQHIAIVGSGAAGIEIAFTLRHRLDRSDTVQTRMTLVSESPLLLPDLDAGTRRRAGRIAGERCIDLRLGAGVVAVDAAGLTLAGGERIPADTVVWVTGAAAPPWIAATALATDAAGFVAINDSLQSLSHPEVFAAGDCATSIADPKPKSGVFAVRQGPVLAGNLLRALRGEPLLAFQSGSAALVILNCGGRHALASWHGRALEGRWVWRWKDWLDRRFIRRYAGRTP